MDIETTLREAATAHRVVRLTVRQQYSGGVVSYLCEPYSIKSKNGVRALFCWHSNVLGVLAVPLANIAAVAVTDTVFVPRYDVEF